MRRTAITRELISGNLKPEEPEARLRELQQIISEHATPEEQAQPVTLDDLQDRSGGSRTNGRTGRGRR